MLLTILLFIRVPKISSCDMFSEVNTNISELISNYFSIRRRRKNLNIKLVKFVLYR